MSEDAEQVAETAGVSALVVARRFDDKPALFQAALDEVSKATMERWRTETAALPDAVARILSPGTGASP